MSSLASDRDLIRLCANLRAERSYVEGLRSWLHDKHPGRSVRIESVDMGGGGYGKLLMRLEAEPDSSCIARIALVDFDRCSDHVELDWL